jgi:hypothetical protein
MERGEHQCMRRCCLESTSVEWGGGHVLKIVVIGRA